MSFVYNSETQTMRATDITTSLKALCLRDIDDQDAVHTSFSSILAMVSKLHRFLPKQLQLLLLELPRQRISCLLTTPFVTKRTTRINQSWAVHFNFGSRSFAKFLAAQLLEL